MQKPRWAFNIYLCLIGAALGLCWTGCRTSEERKRDKEFTFLTLHQEVNPDGTPRTKTVQVVRANPIRVGMMVSPFLDENNITNAVVIDTVGGYALEIRFDDRGTRMLNAFTAANRGQRIGVFCSFPDERWLGAPRIGAPIVNGVLSFTPDASREECERIVRGLRNKYHDRSKKSKTWGLTPDP